LLLIVALASCSSSGDGTIALEGATLIDGSGGDPIKDALVLVQHGHIQAVARVNEIPVPRGAQGVNLNGKTIIAGLIDAHAHVERWAALRYIAWGVTTVRDLGASSTDSSIALKNDFDLGSVLGPRMLTSGAMIDGPGPTYATATAVRTAAEVRRAVDLRAVAGADHVKIYTKFTADLLRPLLDEATTLRLPVAAHLAKIDALTAARAGVAGRPRRWAGPRSIPARSRARRVRSWPPASRSCPPSWCTKCSRGSTTRRSFRARAWRTFRPAPRACAMSRGCCVGRGGAAPNSRRSGDRALVKTSSSASSSGRAGSSRPAPT